MHFVKIKEEENDHEEVEQEEIEHEEIEQEEIEQNDQMAFVVLLSDYKILFDKKQTPSVKVLKEKAALEMAQILTKTTNHIGKKIKVFISCTPGNVDNRVDFVRSKQSVKDSALPKQTV